MESELSNMLSSQNRLNNLISMVGSSGTKGQTNESSGSGPVWVAPVDRTLECFQLADLVEESTTTSGLNELASLLTKHPTSEKQKTLNKNRRFKSAFIQLNPIVYPKQVKLCPSMEEVKRMLMEERLIISVNSYSGYSFSTEFTHVYKGKFNAPSALEDLMVVIKRALRATSSGMTDKTCTSYAEFITRIGAWESELYSSVLNESSKTRFPTWTAHPVPVPLNREFRFVEVFIGHNEKGELSFSVRVRTELELEAVASDDKVKANPPAGNNPDIEIDPQFGVECVYYREFILNDATVGAFSQVSFMGAAPASKGSTVLGKAPAQMVPPPPPPKRSKKGNGDKGGDYEDIRIFLMVSQKVVPARVEDEAAGTAGEGLPMEPANNNSTGADQTGDMRSVNDDDSLASVRESRPEKSQEVSFCAELYGWGFDSNRSLGLGDQPRQRTAQKPAAGAAKSSGKVEEGGDGAAAAEDEIRDFVQGPRRIPLDRIAALERVRMLACSSNHTLLLTCMGSVFSCGDNSEGALGTGDFVNR